MDVKTGFVKAIVNLTQASDNEYYELYNHAIGTKEVPGSTFKLASLMAALEEEKMNIKDNTIRLSVGLENIDDLYQDILQALPRIEVYP